jgi:polyisoprenoid-binding protein YceI
MKGYKSLLSLIAVAAFLPLTSASSAPAHGYLPHNLVSDTAVTGTDHVDPDLLNPWGVVFFPGGPFWISDNGARASTLYDGTGNRIPLTVTNSTIRFAVDASIAIAGTFDKWKATLTFMSPDVTTAALDVEIQAASVDTGSGLKDSKLKSGDFFDVENNPLITFKSTKIVQTGANTFEMDGNFTIRGVTKPEKLTLTVSGRGTGSGTIKGTMVFDRKDYGMNSCIPFIRIASRVEVTVGFKAKRIG